MSRYVTLPHAVYGVCTPSRCVCTQFCGVRHPNVSISEPRMKRSWIGVFFILPCWPSPSSICSVALLLLHYCRRPLWVVLYRLFLQHGCGTITRTSNAVEGLAAACSWRLTNYYCETWSHGKREGKAKKSSHKEAVIWKKNPRLLICWRLRKEKAKQEKKLQRSRYKDEIPDFLFRYTQF